MKLTASDTSLVRLAIEIAELIAVDRDTRSLKPLNGIVSSPAPGKVVLCSQFAKLLRASLSCENVG